MSATIINLIIQLIAGVVGGNAAGAASKDISLGTFGNTIAGAVGGVGGGQLLSALIPMMAGAGNNLDIGALASQAVGGWRRRCDCRCRRRLDQKQDGILARLSAGSSASRPLCQILRRT
jgi:hypothetical protein